MSANMYVTMPTVAPSTMPQQPLCYMLSIAQLVQSVAQFLPQNLEALGCSPLLCSFSFTWFNAVCDYKQW